jgi:hypothetical protein
MTTRFRIIAGIDVEHFREVDNLGLRRVERGKGHKTCPGVAWSCSVWTVPFVNGERLSFRKSSMTLWMISSRNGRS